MTMTVMHDTIKYFTLHSVTTGGDRIYEDHVNV